MYMYKNAKIMVEKIAIVLVKTHFNCQNWKLVRIICFVTKTAALRK